MNMDYATTEDIFSSPEDSDLCDEVREKFLADLRQNKQEERIREQQDWSYLAEKRVGAETN